MKLNHYLMLEAFQQADTDKAVQIFQEHFGLSIVDLSVEVHPTHLHGDAVHLWDGPGYYKWTAESGFGKSFAKFNRRTSCAITLRV